MKLIKIAHKIIEATWTIWKHSLFALDSPFSQQQVFLEINEKVKIRTLRALLILFQLSGYQVLLRGRFSRWALNVAKSLNWHPNTKFFWRTPTVNGQSLLCTDRPIESLGEAKGYQKIIQLCFDYQPQLELDSGHFVMPFPMHTQIYLQYKDHERLEQYRTTPRKIKILFAGSYNKEGYDGAIFRDAFGLLTRYQIIEFLQTEQLVKLVRSADELETLLAGDYYNSFALIDANHMRVNQQQWLSLLSKVDFFLCPPVIVLPCSHNLVEAMAVGTIPLINYPNWFFPHLTHLENCITFSTLQDLKMGLSMILEMTPIEIASLRERVINYYCNHLYPQKFLNNLLKAPQKNLYLHLWDEDEVLLRHLFAK